MFTAIQWKTKHSTTSGHFKILSGQS